MEIMNNESFGPVMPVCRVKKLRRGAGARQQFPGTASASFVFTNDLAETMRSIQELEAGMTWINATALLDNDDGPFGGRKMSGTGRQLGSEGLDQFRHTTADDDRPREQAGDFWWFPYEDAEAWPG